MEKIEGVVQAIIFANDSNTFCVFRVKVKEKTAPVTVTANYPPPLVGQAVSLEGQWVIHKRFGQQLKAEKMIVVAPTDERGIERFLGSGQIEGIGLAMAHRIVSLFGKKTLDIMSKAPERLKEVKGIGQKTLEKIISSYQEQGELREIIIWLEQHGISGTFAAKVYECYGAASISVIEDDPFCLARDIDGIGFLTADKIAANLGTKQNDYARLRAGIDYSIMQIASQGHCCLPQSELLHRAAKLLNVPSEEIGPVLYKLINAGEFCTEDLAGRTLLYPPYLYFAERQAAERILTLRRIKGIDSCVDFSELLVLWEQKQGISLAQKQREAVFGALENGFFVMTGGPGTGKTTVVRAMLALLQQAGLKVLLSAPTGRAAKRLSEATGKEAVTVHRLLEAGGRKENGGMLFGKGADEPIEADAIIVDEVSMMDIVLMQHFLNAVSDDCRIILVGDADQLPSVGPGMVLRDILRSETVASIKLDEIFRQTSGSMIVKNAHAINSGYMPQYGKSDDFIFLEIQDEEKAAQKIVELNEHILSAEGYDPRHDVQVITPMHRLSCGVTNLNARLQTALNPPAAEKKEYNASFQPLREGDKVMQVRNNYEKKVFNGDIGFIESICGDHLRVCFGDVYAEYKGAEIGELVLAYAMSVHKSQGSEYPVIILPLTEGHFIMLQRNLLYTAVTRAKKKVVLLGTKRALAAAVQNNRTKKRYTLLTERLTRALVEG